MKLFSWVALMCLLAPSAFGQLTDSEKFLRNQATDTLVGWNTGGIASMNVTQTSFTHWSAGGENSLSGNGLFSVFANYKSHASAWDNSLDLGYGLLMQGKDKRLVKTDDKLELLSKYGRKAFGNWYYAGLFDFKTQFAPGYNYPNDSVVISNFMAPGYVLAGIGMDYKPDNTFSLFLSPLTAKLTVVTNQRLANTGAFGVDPAVFDSSGRVLTKGRNLKAELGGYIRSQFQKEIVKNVVLNTKLDLFSNYLKNPQNIDVNWSTVLALKANQYITVTLSTELIYDDDIRIAVDKNDDGIPERVGPRAQFKEVLGIGLSYKF